MGERRLKAAVVEWLAIASASTAVACLIGWGASIATPKAGFSMAFPSEFGLSVSDGALEFGQGPWHLREVDYGGVVGWRLPGLRHQSYTRLRYDYFIAKMRKAGHWSITSVSLLFPVAFFGLAALCLVRSYRRISRPSHSIVHE